MKNSGLLSRSALCAHITGLARSLRCLARERTVQYLPIDEVDVSFYGDKNVRRGLPKLKQALSTPLIYRGIGLSPTP